MTLFNINISRFQNDKFYDIGDQIYYENGFEAPEQNTIKNISYYPGEKITVSFGSDFPKRFSFYLLNDNQKVISPSQYYLEFGEAADAVNINLKDKSVKPKYLVMVDDNTKDVIFKFKLEAVIIQ